MSQRSTEALAAVGDLILVSQGTRGLIAAGSHEKSARAEYCESEGHAALFDEETKILSPAMPGFWVQVTWWRLAKILLDQAAISRDLDMQLSLAWGPAAGLVTSSLGMIIPA